MTTYKDLQAELQLLHVRAQEARRAERAEVLEKIRALIVEHELLPSDFGFAAAGTRRAAPVAAKYIDRDTGATWSGRGRAPKWLEGKDRAKFEI